jgi:hypothetical protein
MNKEAVECFNKAISDLMYAWGSDTPPEAYWVLNNLVCFLNKEYDLSLDSIPESEDGPDEVLYNEIKKAIEELGDS